VLKKDDEGSYPLCVKTVTAANEFITMNAKHCISISYDMEHHTDVLKVRIAEHSLKEKGLLFNVNPVNVVNVWSESASVTAADNMTGCVPAGTDIQNAMLESMREAKIKDKNYALLKFDLSIFDEDDEALHGKPKVLEVCFHFCTTTPVPFF